MGPTPYESGFNLLAGAAITFTHLSLLSSFLSILSAHLYSLSAPLFLIPSPSSFHLSALFFPLYSPSPPPSIDGLGYHLSMLCSTSSEIWVLQEKWTTYYLFTEVNGKLACLVCSQHISVLKKNKILKGIIRLLMLRFTITFKDNW